MKRRVAVSMALCGWAAALSRAVRAQPAARRKLVAFLGFTDPQLAQAGGYDEFKQALGERGWIEGRNVDYVARWAEGHSERLPQLARELVALRPDVIWTLFSPSALALREATSTIPIVVNIADPVGAGLAQSLARPGGNVTGLSNINVEIGPKLVELLRSVLPNLARVGVLWNPDSSANAATLKNLRAGAESLHVGLVPAEARTLAEIELALLRMSREAVEAVVLLIDGMFVAHGRRINELLAQYRLPAAMLGRLALGIVGGLMSYAASEDWARLVYYVGRILEGAKPADLPIEQPTRFELVINLKTAKALGIVIPKSLLLRADEVIE